MVMTKQQVIKRILTDPELYAKTFLRIKDKQMDTVPFVWNRAQAHYMQKRTMWDIIVKARQLGFSTAIQGELHRRHRTSAINTITLADIDDNTQKLRRMYRRYNDEWNKNNPRTKPLIKEDNAGIIVYKDTGAESAIVTAGAKTGGRAGTYLFGHGSEVAFWKDLQTAFTAFLQAIPIHGGAVLESTTNGAQGAFYELVQESRIGANKWATHFYEWWWDDNYRIPLLVPDEIKPEPEEAYLMQMHGLDLEQIKFRRMKQSELKYLFLQEYPEDIDTCFISGGNGYFGNLDKAFTAPMPAEPIEGEVYYAGLDFGQKNDYTVLSIGRASTSEQVAMYRIQGDWGPQYIQISLWCKRWGVRAILADATSMQTAIIQALVAQFQRDGVTTEVIPFPFTPKNKPQLMAALHQSLHDGLYTLQPYPVQRAEFNSFIAKQSASGAWQYTHPAGGHDDTVIACALLLQVMRMGAMSTEARIL